MKTSEGLDALVDIIDNQDKTINTIEKSKLDWDKYTKEKKLEKELEQNRKDGYLAKKRFLDKVSDNEYAQKRQV